MALEMASRDRGTGDGSEVVAPRRWHLRWHLRWQRDGIGDGRETRDGAAVAYAPIWPIPDPTRTPGSVGGEEKRLTSRLTRRTSPSRKKACPRTAPEETLATGEPDGCLDTRDVCMYVMVYAYVVGESLVRFEVRHCA